MSTRFGAVLALRDVSLEVAPGEIVMLLGPNGSGKSTLLRILGTTVRADTGAASIAGHDVVREGRAARRALGFLVPDERSWYWRLTGRENLEFFAALHGLGRRDAACRTADLLAQMGLEDAADRRFGEYSAGMRLRLSLCRALVADPRALLLDEPTRSLDPVARSEFGDLLQRFADTGMATLMVSHDVHEAVAWGSRWGILDPGEPVRWIASPDSEELAGALAAP